MGPALLCTLLCRLLRLVLAAMTLLAMASMLLEPSGAEVMSDACLCKLRGLPAWPAVEVDLCSRWAGPWP